MADDQRPLDRDEINKVRDLISDWGTNGPTLISMAELARSGGTLTKVFGAAAILGGGIAWAIQQGWFSG